MLTTWARLTDAVLDPTIVLSFDRSGFLRHARSFAPGDLDVDLDGRVAIVTGANSGLGYATAEGLARRGATVVLACRDLERGRAARDALRRDTRSRRVELARLDVADLEDVRRFVRELAHPAVHVLVHNAGVLPARREQTLQGLERTFATHVEGPFLLTRLLRPRLRRAGGARVVIVSSGGMYTRRLDLSDWEWRARPWDGVLAYADTKRMQVVLAELLAGRLRRDGIDVNAMHPGWADTPAVRSSLPRFFSLMKGRLRTPAEGADTVVWLAAAEAARGRTGLFWFDRAPRGVHLLPWTRETAADRAALWALCLRIARRPAGRAGTRRA